MQTHWLNPYALRAACGWSCVSGGAAALAAGAMLAAVQAGTHAMAYTASAVVLLAMVALPAVIARFFPVRATLPIATSLLLTMTSMSFAASQPAYAVPAGGALAMIVAGAATLAASWVRLLAGARSARERSISMPMHYHKATQRAGPKNSLSNTTLLVAPALLAGLSSGVLARFQFFAICGASAFTPAQAAASLAAVLAGGWIAQRASHRHALLALFALRGALLGALTLDALAPYGALAGPAFAVLDYLTLPTLMRLGAAAHTARAGCAGGAHHAGMLAGAALATTPWCFGQGFYALFLCGGVLNLTCAGLFAIRHATRHAGAAPPSWPAPVPLAAAGAIETA